MDKKQSQGNSMEKNHNNSRKKIFFWAFLMFGILSLLILLFSSFSFWILVYIVAWFFFLRFSWKFINSEKISWTMMISIGIGIIILSFVCIGLSDLGKEKNNKSGKNGSSSSSQLKEYDGKIFQLKDKEGKFIGLVGLTFKKGKKKDFLSAFYNLKIKDNFKVNGECPYNPNGCGGRIEYVYSNDLIDIRATSDERDDEGGFLSVYCNKDAEFDNNKAFESQSILFDCSPGSAGYENYGKVTTDTFSAHFSKNFYSIEDFLATNQFGVYDAANFVYEEKIDDNSSSWGADHQKAIMEGQKVSEYIFEINAIQN